MILSVQHVPNLQKRLLSVREFNEYGCELYEGQGQ